ncbi:MAG: RluA family pseudouridine synthase [Phycisphaeraceae bacterium]|nr:RluA family pseudouridine synthase [Phycisphaeraceae bacterium]
MQASQPEQSDPLETTVHQEGLRLDKAVAEWRGLSRAAVWRLLDQGAVACNGRMMRRKHKGDLLRAGDRLSIAANYAQGEAPLPDATARLTVIQQGEGWLVVDKPEGMPVRPHALGEKGTVLNAVVAMHPEIVGVGEGGLRSGIVHRLDNDTSGTLLLATTEPAWVRLRAAFAEHRVGKKYMALLYGSPQDTGQQILYLRVAQHSPALVKAGINRHPSSTYCSLAWRVMERFGDRASLVEVDLHTGFLHQVRVMMAGLGHPVVGDKLYGPAEQAIQAPRQMLHAQSLRHDDIDVHAPVPQDMQTVLQLLRA